MVVTSLFKGELRVRVFDIGNIGDDRKSGDCEHVCAGALWEVEV